MAECVPGLASWGQHSKGQRSIISSSWRLKSTLRVWPGGVCLGRSAGVQGHRHASAFTCTTLCGSGPTFPPFMRTAVTLDQVPLPQCGLILLITSAMILFPNMAASGVPGLGLQHVNIRGHNSTCDSNCGAALCIRWPTRGTMPPWALHRPWPHLATRTHPSVCWEGFSGLRDRGPGLHRAHEQGWRRARPGAGAGGHSWLGRHPGCCVHLGPRTPREPPRAPAVGDFPWKRLQFNRSLQSTSQMKGNLELNFPFFLISDREIASVG